MGVKPMLFTATLALASAGLSPISFSDEADADAKIKRTNVKIDSIPPVTVTCNRCDALAREYHSSRVNAGGVSRPKGIPPHSNQEVEEAE